MAARQALHARRLHFRHPSTGKQITFVSPFPADFADLLAALRFPEGESGRAMGVDPGEARVGLALSDEARMLASSLTTVRAKSVEEAALAVAAAARESDVGLIVVGNPVRMDGSVGPRSLHAREMAVAIEDAARVRVVLQDERLSSAQATSIMRETGERTRKKKGRVDQIAASVILQSYLDSLPSMP